MRVRLSEIVWDTEVDSVVHDVDLPTEMVVEIDEEGFDDDPSFLEDEAMDSASDKTGWCIKDCNIQLNYRPSGTEGQDRESYSDNQDRENYLIDEGDE
jgi:hypothetical protein